jgi:acyl-CoA synthetase (NDP forming)
MVKKEERRELISTLASLRAILNPRSVAVVGASRIPGTIGHLVLQSIVQNGFSGVVYPVNPNADAVLSIKTHPSVLDIAGDVDLAVIVVPTQLVAKVADECGRKGVHAIIVISDGFKGGARTALPANKSYARLHSVAVCDLWAQTAWGSSTLIQP